MLAACCKLKKTITKNILKLCSRHRIREIIAQISDYGVEEKYIFTVEDVLEKKRPNKIIRCLEEVRKLVSHNVNDVKYVNNMNVVNPLELSGSKTRTGPRSSWTLSSGTSSTPDGQLKSNTKLDIGKCTIP